ncbi:RNA 2'-phosphotransferase [Streptosporangium amethystogenes]|uniref:RNA 2'-phosphotransferase n=1 Tax=Streptosporangium amethystogenes TaxID=2002 RepID=UPI0004C7515C|nr:RNA 2'-phosphotransferase [Streptosporangium amethystogenes]
MDNRRLVRVSKYLSAHLRHQPERIGLVLSPQGWADIDALLAAAARHGLTITRDELAQVVAGNDKRRFTIEGDRIRANQGHTVEVDLDLPAVEPPEVLFHGTVGSRVAAIRADGLRPMTRHAVHLSPDRETATRVGARRGRPVVLVVRSGEMHRAGHEFQISANGVWLTAHVPSTHISFPG